MGTRGPAGIFVRGGGASPKCPICTKKTPYMYKKAPHMYKKAPYMNKKSPPNGEKVAKMPPHGETSSQ